MDVFTMVTAIVVVSVVGNTLSTWFKTRQRNDDRQGEQERQALQREIAELRQRVATLESIVTEPAFDLRRQIDNLEPRGRIAA